MSMSFRVAAFPVVLTTALSACGGGGGGGGSVIRQIPEVPFTSFSATAPNTTVVMPGLSQSLSGANDDPVDATAKLTYGANGELSGIAFSSPQVSTSFGASQISERIIDGRRTSYVALDGPSSVSVVDPAFFGWNYQSFGTWMEDIDPFQFGVVSAGAVTPASAVPSTGTANFIGQAGGIYIDGANRYGTDAQMSAFADFGNRSIQFSTTGTMLAPIGESAPSTLDPATLNLSGNLTYAPGTSQFSGAVATQGSALTGDASGRFYGPNAEEIGGVYGLTGSGGRRMLGGFGGKR